MGLMGIPEVLAGALDTNTATAALILSMIIIVTVAMILAALDAEILPVIICVIGVAGALTAIGWLNQWFLIIAALTICALFGIRAAAATTGGTE